MTEDWADTLATHGLFWAILSDDNVMHLRLMNEAVALFLKIEHVRRVPQLVQSIQAAELQQQLQENQRLINEADGLYLDIDTFKKLKETAKRGRSMTFSEFSKDTSPLADTLAGGGFSINTLLAMDPRIGSMIRFGCQSALKHYL
jgi:hypothetical protein